MKCCGLLCSPGLCPSPAPPQTGAPNPAPPVPAPPFSQPAGPWAGITLEHTYRGHVQRALHLQHHRDPVPGEFDPPTGTSPSLGPKQAALTALVKTKQKQKPKPTSWQHSLLVATVSPGGPRLVRLPPWQMKRGSQNRLPPGASLTLDTSCFPVCRLFPQGKSWTRR